MQSHNPFTGSQKFTREAYAWIRAWVQVRIRYNDMVIFEKLGH